MADEKKCDFEGELKTFKNQGWGWKKRSDSF